MRFFPVSPSRREGNFSGELYQKPRTHHRWARSPAGGAGPSVGSFGLVDGSDTYQDGVGREVQRPWDGHALFPGASTSNSLWPRRETVIDSHTRPTSPTRAGRRTGGIRDNAYDQRLHQTGSKVRSCSSIMTLRTWWGKALSARRACA